MKRAISGEGGSAAIGRTGGAGRMRGVRTAGALLLLAAGIEGSACAMQADQGSALRCAVKGEAKLPDELRQGNALCAALGRALEGAAARSGLDAGSIALTVRVDSPSMLAATTAISGRALPEQRLGVADRPLNLRSVERFGAALAAQLLADAAGRR